MSFSPHCETNWSRIRVAINPTVLNFDRFAVRICKQCLQTVLASGQPGPKKIPGVATEHTLLSEFVVTTMQGFGSLCEKMC